MVTTKLSAFINLDFITMKPYFTPRNLAIYVGLILFLTYIGNGGSGSMAMGIMFGILFATYPFALGEKCNMDALYTTLSLDRKTVVAGRYLFSLVLDISIVVMMFVLTIIIMLVSGEAAQGTYMLEAATVMGIMAAIIIFLQALMLPIYFKLGYTKARFASLLPVGLLAAGYISFTTYLNMLGESGITTAVAVLDGSLGIGGIIALAVLCLALMMFISYKLSVSFYEKREF